MEDKLQIETKTNQSTSLSILAHSVDIDLTSDLWAVNWFNTKRPWLYNIYTTLMSPLVGKVGGKLVFKGSFVKKLDGHEKDGRKTLLIVKYPSAADFIDLVSKKAVLFYSILRIMSVERFMFGFTHQLDTNEIKPQKTAKGSPCLVHHFRGEIDIQATFNQLSSIAISNGVDLCYAGKKAATLKRSHNTEGSYEIPFTMDGILVFVAKDEANLQSFYATPDYQSFIASLDNSYAAIFSKSL